MAEQNNPRDQGEGSSENVRKQIVDFNELISYDGSDRVLTWREYLINKDKNIGKTIALSSGFTEFDYFTDGFQTGELITISGYTGMGKTLFLKSLIRSFGIGEIPTMMFCYEDAPERYLRKFQDEGANYPICLPMELKTGNVSWIADRVMEAKLKYDVRVVTIDHLHYLLDIKGGYENVSLKIGSVMRYLKKRVAEEMNVVVFIVAHQGKPKDDMVEASLETIRDSGLISNESDDVVVVQRLPDEEVKKSKEKTYDKNYALVKIEKARRKGTYRKRLTFQKIGDWLAPI